MVEAGNVLVARIAAGRVEDQLITVNVGRGNSRLPMLTAAFDSRFAGITSPGKRNPVRGSIGFDLLCEKSPERSAAVGNT